MAKLLTEEFLDKYGDFPEHMNELGKFVYYRTYSRYLPEKGRRETWKETVARATEYNVGLGVKHTEKIGYAVDYDKFRKEAEELFDNMFNLRQFLSGRTLWVGGADGSVAEKYPLSNFNCFTRDTEFITDQGVKSFEDFEDGDKVNVLSKTGGWKEATVKSFGKSEIYELQVRKGKRVETIQTTDNHRWFIDKGGKWKTRTTLELKQGDRLRRKQRYENNSVQPCLIGISHGIVFGDGTYDKKSGNTRVHLCNDKRSLIDYVIGGNVIEYEKDNQTIVTGLPHFFKELPIEANIEYKLGFLIGLIATDGNVSRNNTTISSSSKDVIDFVRDTAILLGIEPGTSQEIEREGFGKVSTLYSINLSAADLKESYILREKHKKEFSETDRKFDYKVESVAKTGRYEDVWCVQEPETETFTLATGILTYNCSFLNIRSYEDFGDMFYLLMVGTGCGFKATKQYASELPPIRNDIDIIHEEYTQRYPLVKEPDTKLYVINDGKKAVIHVGDSKEGWVEALRIFFRLHTESEYESVEQIGIFYDYIRPKGARLRTFGGTASGHEPLRDMFEGISKVIRNEIDDWLAPLETVGENRVKLRPVHILDIGNLIGNNVVVGGVRRTAEIFLFDADDYESMFAKYGINGVWNVEQHSTLIRLLRDNGMDDWAIKLSMLKIEDSNARPLHHRRMSNNSIAFEKQPSREFLNLVFELMQAEGEPGFINLEEAKRRRPNAEGLNPCAMSN